MQRPLSALTGQISAGWHHSAFAAPPVVRQISTSQSQPAPAELPDVSSFLPQFGGERPELAVALERLAGIDPAQRQAHYEEIRKELLKLAQSTPAADESQASPQQAVFQAYRQASQAEVPTALLNLPPS